jgi:hypothetical protein
MRPGSKVWTEEEIAILIDMKRRGHSIPEIASELGRGENSVANRASSLRSTIVDGAGIVFRPPQAFVHADLTAKIMGDPPPGRSALDQRAQAGAA